jgi:hypothetical protein
MAGEMRPMPADYWPRINVTIADHEPCGGYGFGLTHLVTDGRMDWDQLRQLLDAVRRAAWQAGEAKRIIDQHEGGGLG